MDLSSIKIRCVVAWFCFLILITGCDTSIDNPLASVSTNNFPEPENLKIEICKSIHVPFTEADTLIYDSFIGICGNSSEDELARYYEPQLNEQPYLEVLKKQFKGTTLHTGDSLYALMDTLCKNNPAGETLWECFSKNKIVLSITGQATDNKSVLIFENYNLNHQSRLIKKQFTFKNDRWEFEIINDTTF